MKKNIAPVAACASSLPDLWQHQQATIDAARDLRSFGLFFEMGAGKTRTAIELLKQKDEQVNYRLKTLILCPLIVCENWKREIERYAPGLAAAYGVEILQGSAIQRAKQLAASKSHIYIANTEILVMHSLWATLSSHPWDCVVFDESHRFKDVKATRTRRATVLADRATYKFILSGSPILKSEADLFCQIRLLSKTLLGDNYYAFLRAYFRDVNAGNPYKKWPDWKLLPGSLDKIENKIGSISHRVLKSEVLDLPPIIRKKVYVSLKGKLAAHYKSLEEEFITFVETAEGVKAVHASIVLTKLLRLQQVCSGILATSEGELLEESPKREALKHLLEEIASREKVIVWANFRASYREIAEVCDELGLSFVSLTGDQSGAEKQEAVDAFNTDPRVRVIIANQAAGGTGIGLQAASTMIYYSRSYNLEHDLQSEARAHRGGSEIHQSITRIDILTSDTVEEQIVEALERKAGLSEFLKGLITKQNAA